MSEWQPIETAPKDGTQFLAALNNGWVTILSEVPGCERYAWYRSNGISVPVARTHIAESLKESILATHWMPLPSPPFCIEPDNSGSIASAAATPPPASPALASIRESCGGVESRNAANDTGIFTRLGSASPILGMPDKGLCQYMPLAGVAPGPQDLTQEQFEDINLRST